MTRLLVVGAGSIGTPARGQREGAWRHGASAIYDADRPRAGICAAAIGGRAFATLDEALAWQPGRGGGLHPAGLTHCDRAALRRRRMPSADREAARRNGRTDIAAARRALAARRHLALRVAYQLRFHPAVRACASWCDRARSARLLSIQAEYGQYLPAWRPSRDYRDTYTAQAAQGGGILLDGSHEIDYVRWIAGEMAAVSASAANA